MTNLEKMRELTGHNATKEQVMDWAYMNRVLVLELADEEPFESMSKSVESFLRKHDIVDEHQNWSAFLDAEWVPQ